MAHAIYCDRCGRESDREVDLHEERGILPGPAEGQLQSVRVKEFVQLDEHRATTGDRIWCMPCWDEVTEKEVSSVWMGAYFKQDKFPALGYIPISKGANFYLSQKWDRKRCSCCKQWLGVPVHPPVVETTIYSTLLGEAGKPIDGWFYGVLFKKGKPQDIRCPEHLKVRKAA